MKLGLDYIGFFKKKKKKKERKKDEYLKYRK